ncbi:hypothetical protein TVAG_313790 [Trichomonas vaginalis G3]|uniref:Baseplate structural protein Gp10 C-terminal domain-containing protein n=1 Tax=Trichomonas vaginalis (strain ATCC PRA-98 / G3) TaxID=412133 RepID=A2EKH7_TRIV3|nr:hypothetical protein TVAG_313790 [Trichomonas vaginalis G3]|eukprot:XP_001319027.1 hypothetical protein [Trichomonas vaginalis G3]
MSNETASMREIQHNRQLIIQALNKNTTNFSNYSKISESLKEGSLKLTLNPMTDEFLFQDNKNHTVCINPTKGTLNEKPIKELLLKADVDNKADKEYVIEKVQEEHDRADATYATKEDVEMKADKTYVDDELACVASALVKKADKEYVDEKDNEIKERVEWYNERTTKILKTKADTGWVSGCLDLKADKNHTHTIANITNLQETLETKANKTHTHSISDITNLQETLNTKANKTHTHTSFTTFTADDITLNTTLPSKGPTIPPATSLVDTLISNDNSIIHLRQELNVLKQILPNLIYPVGSIYTSMNSTRPEVVLGFGTWTQIVDRFLYCANSSKETGGSKTISGANLPAHSHYVSLTTSREGGHKHRYWDWTGMTKGKGYDVKDNVQFAINCYLDNTEVGGDHTHFVSGYTQTTGQSKDYMPPYMTVYAWYRNA